MTKPNYLPDMLEELRERVQVLHQMGLTVRNISDQLYGLTQSR